MSGQKCPAYQRFDIQGFSSPEYVVKSLHYSFGIAISVIQDMCKGTVDAEAVPNFSREDK